MAFKNPFGHSFGTTPFKEYGGGKNIWHEVKAAYPVGGTLDVSGKAAGTVIPAGTFMGLDQKNKVLVEKANIASYEAAPLVFGCTMNDILIDDAAKASDGVVTATLVYDGEIYASRTSLDAADLAKMPNIIPIYE